MLENVMPYVLSKEDLMKIKNFQRQEPNRVISGNYRNGHRPKSQSIYHSKGVQYVEQAGPGYHQNPRNKSQQVGHNIANSSFASIQPNIYQKMPNRQHPMINQRGSVPKREIPRSSHMSEHLNESVNKEVLLSKQNSGQNQQLSRLNASARRNSGASLELWYSRPNDIKTTVAESSETLNYNSNPRRSAGNEIFMSSQRPKHKKQANYFLYSQNLKNKKEFKENSNSDINSLRLGEDLENGSSKDQTERINRPLQELGVDEFKIIFRLLDEKQRGSISKDNFRFADLPLQTINQLEPFIKEMLIQDQTLDFQEFLNKVQSIVQFSK